MLYERTSAVYLATRINDPGAGLYHWTTSVYENATL